MNNIFENAKFGDKFLTSGGEIAIYQNSDRDEYHGRFHNLITPTKSIYCEDNGEYTMKSDYNWQYDIISHYQEPIDEEKLDEVASEYALKELGKEHYPEFGEIKNNFKARYRKAMEK